MKTIIAATGIAVASFISFTKNKPLAESSAINGFAVVELFTSEGCSSCPPADEALAKVKTEYGSNVFVMAFHVDYWNRLGWKDEYSSNAYSKRQSEYSRLFHLNGVYTPQAVVNGVDQFTGSNVAKLHNSINQQLKNTDNKDWNLQAKFSGSKVLVSCNASVDKTSVLHIALIEINTSSQVTAGENSGRKLQHTNVVRDYITLAATPAAGSFQQLRLPAGINNNNVAVIAYTQDRATGAIKSAKQAVPAG